MRQRERKSVSHVVLGGSDVALGVQCDVARQGSGHFVVKREERREPRRIGRWRCRVGSPMRRGWTRKRTFCGKKRRKARATSYWKVAMSRWRSNRTWRGKKVGDLSQKERKSESHVVLEGSDVALGVQRDVAQNVS